MGHDLITPSFPYLLPAFSWRPSTVLDHIHEIDCLARCHHRRRRRYSLRRLSSALFQAYLQDLQRSDVFKSAGVPSDIANMSVGVVNLSGSIVAMVLMDKLGRKGLLLGSFLGMAMSMAMQAVAGSTLISGSSMVYLSVGGVLLFVLSFAMGVGPVPGLLLSEIFPSRIRAKAMAICMAIGMLEQLGPLILYTIFASFCLVGFLFVRNNVVETKGKTLQEIEMALLAA